MIEPPVARLRARSLLADGLALPVMLDLARGIASLAVLMFHIRTWLFVPYGELDGRGPAAFAFYLATTFGHDAVIVFFVLSGFLIGGAVLRIDVAAPQPFRPYVAARIARIAPVLLGAVSFATVTQIVLAKLDPSAACRDPALRVVGNVFALANLGVMPLCNDLPLWSLSNEVVYYLAFPVLVAVWRGDRSRLLLVAAAFMLAAGAAALRFTPMDQQNVIPYFPIWLVGSALWLVPTGRLPLWPGFAVLALALVFSHLELAQTLFLGRDLLTAVGVALLLAGTFGRAWPRHGWLGRVASVLRLVAGATASISFSLYVVHGPVLQIYQVWAQGHGVTLPLRHLDPRAWATVAGLGTASIAVAMLFSLVFESRHRTLADFMLRHWPFLGGAVVLRRTLPAGVQTGSRRPQ